jgi:hypothetical protein
VSWTQLGVPVRGRDNHAAQCAAGGSDGSDTDDGGGGGGSASSGDGSSSGSSSSSSSSAPSGVPLPTEAPSDTQLKLLWRHLHANEGWTIKPGSGLSSWHYLPPQPAAGAGAQRVLGLDMFGDKEAVWTHLRSTRPLLLHNEAVWMHQRAPAHEAGSASGEESEEGSAQEEQQPQAHSREDGQALPLRPPPAPAPPANAPSAGGAPSPAAVHDSILPEAAGAVVGAAAAADPVAATMPVAAVAAVVVKLEPAPEEHAVPHPSQHAACMARLLLARAPSEPLSKRLRVAAGGGGAAGGGEQPRGETAAAICAQLAQEAGSLEQLAPAAFICNTLAFEAGARYQGPDCAGVVLPALRRETPVSAGSSRLKTTYLDGCLAKARPKPSDYAGTPRTDLAVRPNARICVGLVREGEELAGEFECVVREGEVLLAGDIVPIACCVHSHGSEDTRAGFSFSLNNAAFDPLPHCAASYVNDYCGPDRGEARKKARKARRNVKMVALYDGAGHAHLFWEVQRTISGGHALLGDYGDGYWKGWQSKQGCYRGDNAVALCHRLLNGLRGCTEAYPIDLAPPPPPPPPSAPAPAAAEGGGASGAADADGLAAGAWESMDWQPEMGSWVRVRWNKGIPIGEMSYVGKVVSVGAAATRGKRKRGTPVFACQLRFHPDTCDQIDKERQWPYDLEVKELGVEWEHAEEPQPAEGAAPAKADAAAASAAAAAAASAARPAVARQKKAGGGAKAPGKVSGKALASAAAPAADAARREVQARPQAVVPPMADEPHFRIIDSDLSQAVEAQVRAAFSTAVSFTGALPTAQQLKQLLDLACSKGWFCSVSSDRQQEMIIDRQDYGSYARLEAGTPVRVYIIFRLTPSAVGGHGDDEDDDAECDDRKGKRAKARSR